MMNNKNVHGVRLKYFKCYCPLAKRSVTEYCHRFFFSLETSMLDFSNEDERINSGKL